MQHLTGHLDRPGDEQYAEQSHRHNDGCTGVPGSEGENKHNQAKHGLSEAEGLSSHPRLMTPVTDRVSAPGLKESSRAYPPESFLV